MSFKRNQYYYFFISFLFFGGKRWVVVIFGVEVIRVEKRRWPLRDIYLTSLIENLKWLLLLLNSLKSTMPTLALNA